MQEPILFNQSIKDNILFGNPDASDSKVYQIAEAANALQFIESNFEELTPEDQLDEVRKDIRKYASIKLKQPVMTEELSKMSDLTALTVVKNALENGDEKFDNLLEENPWFFIDHVQNELCGKNIVGMKWDDLILKVEWKHRTVQYIDEEVKDEQRVKFLKQMAIECPEMFDDKIIDNSQFDHINTF